MTFKGSRPCITTLILIREHLRVAPLRFHCIMTQSFHPGWTRTWAVLTRDPTPSTCSPAAVWRLTPVYQTHFRWVVAAIAPSGIHGCLVHLQDHPLCPVPLTFCGHRHHGHHHQHTDCHQHTRGWHRTLGQNHFKRICLSWNGVPSRTFCKIDKDFRLAAGHWPQCVEVLRAGVKRQPALIRMHW